MNPFKNQTVLVIGSGGRESCIAHKLLSSPRVNRVVVCPGNAGCCGKEGLSSVPNPQGEGNLNGYLQIAEEIKADLVFVGPEIPLVEGISDLLSSKGIKCFGPTKSASILEASKAFSKDFFTRHSLPTARFKTFSSYEDAIRHVKEVPYPVVIKASGLCAGKGVLIPDPPGNVEQAVKAIEQIMKDKSFGTAGDEVVIEELLIGEECSVLALCDGKFSVCLPPAQDHKRALDGDNGLNTGGMGAYAPAPVVKNDSKLFEKIKKIVQKTLDGLKEEGRPFVGVLFAGLMITSNDKQPYLLEYNVRLGDPETQVVLPLLKSDLFSLAEACVNGELENFGEIEFLDDEHSAATVVIASKGYPESYKKGMKISGFENANKVQGVTVYHAGTRLSDNGDVEANGGRILAVTGLGKSLEEAVSKAYVGCKHIRFDPADSFFYRSDIGHRALKNKKPKLSQ